MKGWPNGQRTQLTQKKKATREGDRGREKKEGNQQIFLEKAILRC